MSSKPLEVAVRRADGVAVLDLHGDISALAEGALNDAYTEAIAAQPRAIALNFTDVEYINSTGIALIVNLLAQARASGMRVLSYGLIEHYVEIFRITRLTDFMQLFADEASALAEVRA